LGTPCYEVVHFVGHIIEVVGEQVPVLIERHRRGLVPELALYGLTLAPEAIISDAAVWRKSWTVTEGTSHPLPGTA
jgi:hypothetical protein